jgi:membrane protein YdbS with pleckstrin-like domain
MDNWMHYLSIPLIIIAITRLLKEGKSNLNTNSIKLPKMYFKAGVIIAIIGSLFALLVGLFFENETETLMGILFLLGFAIIGLVLIIWFANWRIDFIADTLIFRNGLRKQRVFQIKDLSYDSHNSNIYIYNGIDMIVTVTVIMLNHDLIAKTIKLKSYNQDSTGTIKGNSVARNFGLTFTILGIVLSLLFLITLYFNENQTEIVISCALLILGLSLLLFGVFLILFRFVWKISISEKEVMVTSILGFKKTYKK